MIKLLVMFVLLVVLSGCGLPTAPQNRYTVEYSVVSLSKIDGMVVHYGYYFEDSRIIGVDMSVMIDIEGEWLSETFSVSYSECIFFLRVDSIDDNVLFSGEIIINGNKGKWRYYSNESLPYNNINFKIASYPDAEGK